LGISVDRLLAAGLNSNINNTHGGSLSNSIDPQAKEQNMNWYLDVLKKYADFGGRARRKEYWMFALFNVLIYIAILIFSAILGSIDNSLALIGSLLLVVYALAIFVPSLAVAVRRLHDTGRSGWWFLIAFVPVVGGIILLVFTVQDSVPGENEYGKNPKEVLA
jgi:uncharacterized membrane protein YhaH (DUF805 family)